MRDRIKSPASVVDSRDWSRLLRADGKGPGARCALRTFRMTVTPAIIVAALCMTVPQLDAQDALPVIMQTHQEVGGVQFTDSFRLSPIVPGKSIDCTITIGNMDQRFVGIHLLGKQEGAEPAEAEYKQSVSYQPTAIARHGDVADAFLVVGWLPRTQQVIVEEWKFVDFSLGTAQDLESGETHTIISEGVEGIRKTVLFLETTGLEIGPISGAAYNPHGNVLYLLELDPARSLHRLTLNADGPGWTLDPDWQSLTALGAGDSVALRSGRHEDKGLVIVTRDRMPWDTMSEQNPFSVTIPSEPRYIVVLEDWDLDGAEDDLFVGTIPQYRSHYEGGDFEPIVLP